MKHHFIDRFSYEKGFLQNLSSSFKFLILILFLFLFLLLPKKILFYLPFIFIILILTFISKIPLKYFLKRILIIFPFLLIIFLLSILSNKNFQNFLYSLLKSILSISYILLFSFTTKMDDFFKIFENKKYGKIIFLIFSFLYRYFFILYDEFERIKRAMISKGKNPNFKEYTILSGNIFVKSYERSERILKAMISKGWKIEK